MSGGSYDYLCWKDGDEIFDYQVLNQMQAMADRLAGLGYAEDAARETTELLCMIRQAKVRIQTRKNRLTDVWRAIEWWDSGDFAEHQVKDTLKDYRGESDE